MPTLYVPSPDSIPVSWGWLQFLLLLTFPLHLLAMNAMIGTLLLGVSQQFIGGAVRGRLAHRLAVVLPILIAFVVNLGVAPLLFVQVLYGQFIYTSSILMGVFWISVIPLLIIAYYSAYLYDFKFEALGAGAQWVGLVVLLMVLVIGYCFVNNMLLMSLPSEFARYFDHRGGTLLATGQRELLPRYLHMMLGAVAIGGLFVALIGQCRSRYDAECSEHARELGLTTFRWATVFNLAAGVWYLISLPREQMLLMMGGNLGASVTFVASLVLAFVVLVTAYARRLALTVGGAVILVFLMTFLRGWVRSGYLAQLFQLDDLVVTPSYSPMIFFAVVLLAGLLCIGWLLKTNARAYNALGR